MQSCNYSPFSLYGSGYTGGIQNAQSVPSATDYSVHIQNLKDRGTYREVAVILQNTPGILLSTNNSCNTTGSPTYPSTDNGQSFEPGVLWGNNFRYSFLRFRANNTPACQQSSVGGIIITAYEGNDTITSYLAS